MSIAGRSPRTLRQVEARIDELERQLARLDHDIDACEKGGLKHALSDRELAELKAERARVAELYIWNIQARQAHLARARDPRRLY